MTDPRIESAEVVLPCDALDDTVAFFRDELGFRLDAITPADRPRAVVLSGYGLRVRLQRGAAGPAGVLRLLTSGGDGVARELMAPNGTRIELVPADGPVDLPSGRSSFVLTKAGTGASWVVGRAGMQYRDLVPDRCGGRFIASHIRVPEGGPVADYVHYHRIRFQVIYCHRGWGRLVYEDQGAPFVMREGDAVLQPPEIRHRVLECSPGFEVVEVTSPAEHETHVDHHMELPNSEARPERATGGQRFAHHRAADAVWRPWRLPGFEARDTGIGAATGGVAGVRIARFAGGDAPASRVDAEFLLLFVLRGGAELDAEGQPSATVGEGDCLVLPAGMLHRFRRCSGDLELLEVSLPADFMTTTTEEEP